MENFPLWGTLVNTGTVILGSLFGLLIHLISKKGKLSSPRFAEISNSIMRGLGLAVVMVGIGGALKGVIHDAMNDAVVSPDLLVDGLSTDNTMITIVSIVLGVLIGGLIDIDRWVNLLGKKVETLFNRNPEQNSVHGPVAQGFVSASLLFCVGSMTVTGSIQAGLTGDTSILITKATLDMVSSMMLASSLGVGVLLSAGSVFVIQGSLVMLAGIIAPLMNAGAVNEMTCAGSLLIVMIGTNLMGITRIKVADYLPAIVFAPILYNIVALFG